MLIDSMYVWVRGDMAFLGMYRFKGLEWQSFCWSELLCLFLDAISLHYHCFVFYMLVLLYVLWLYNFLAYSVWLHYCFVVCSVHYCSALPKSKLNTKIGLHTTPPPPTHHHKLFTKKGLSSGYEILHIVLNHQKFKTRGENKIAPLPTPPPGLAIF